MPLPRYSSPNPEKPNLGVLAADAVRVMARYIQNHVNRTEGIGALKLEPPGDLAVPPLRTYVYIPVTGQIVSRVATGDDQEQLSSKKKNVAPGSSTPTPSKEKTIVDPITPASTKTTGVKRKLQLGKDESDDDDAEEDDDDEVEDDAAAELEMLDQLEKASSSSKKKKKRVAKTTGGAVVKGK